VFDSDEHSSLLRNGTIYNRKKFLAQVPGLVVESLTLSFYLRFLDLIMRQLNLNLLNVDRLSYCDIELRFWFQCRSVLFFGHKKYQGILKREVSLYR
jgi:hypothetical protein